MAGSFPRLAIQEKKDMSTQKRRTPKTRTHQSVKASSQNKKSIDWMKIIVIVIGVLIIASMLLSLFIVPGSTGGF